MNPGGLQTGEEVEESPEQAPFLGRKERGSLQGLAGL